MAFNKVPSVTDSGGLTDYSKHLVSTPITSTTTVEKLTKGQGSGPLGNSKIEHPGVFNTKNSGCSIAVEGSKTLNTGNYTSARIGVTITIPCDPQLIYEAFNWGSDFVSQKIEEVEKGVK